MQTIHRGIIDLLKSAVTGMSVRLPEGFKVESAAGILLGQGVYSLGYQGAINCGVSKNDPVMQQLMLRYYRHMAFSERQVRAIESLFRVFEEKGIDYMPLKGCNMKQLYPKPELRAMGDADILIRVEQLEMLRPIMESLGYQLKVESDHTDNWRSTDLYVELHKSLVPPEDSEYYAYYGSGWRIAKKGEGYRYDPTPEDTFIFLFTHFARHYRGSGIGCRHVVDLFIFRRTHPDMNEKYIMGEMKKLHLQNFYQNVLRMLDVWFQDAEPDEITELMTAFVFSGGSWGSMESGLYSQEMKKAGRGGDLRSVKSGAIGRAIFPPMSLMKSRYQILRRMPWAMPVFWVIRWFDVLLFSPRRMLRKIRILRDIQEDKVLSYRQAMNAVGLDFYSE